MYVITINFLQPMNKFDEYSETYQQELDNCLRNWGDSASYFAEYKACYLKKFLYPDYSGNILDYGCGVGLLATQVAKHLPRVRISGYDLSAASIEKIGNDLTSRGVFTHDIAQLDENYDLILLSNVLHHISRKEREVTIKNLFNRLSHTGLIIIFEHNPSNPFTRRVVGCCRFDSDAQLLTPSEAAGYLLKTGMQISKRDYIVFFPRLLKWLRPLERHIGWLPIGAQYVITGKRKKIH